MSLLPVIMTAVSVAGSSSSSAEPFQETLQQLARLNKNMKQKYRSVQYSTVQYRLCTVQYRSIGIMDDFSGIVTNMIGSLQEVQVDIVVSIQQFLIMSLNISVKRRSHGQEN